MTPEKLYDLHGEKMFHYAALRLGSSEDAEDVLQEAFYRLSRYSLRWVLVRNPKAFIFTVLRNEINRFLRRKINRPASINMASVTGGSPFEGRPAPFGRDFGTARNPAQDSGLHGLQPDEPGFIDPGDLLSSKMTAAFVALPEGQREVVILKVFQGLTFKEIAVVCGISTNTAASRYRYALEKLRQSLGRER